MTLYDHAGNEVDPRDVLDREELADYYASQRNKAPRRRDRGVPVHKPFTWEPTEVDIEAGRTS